MSATRQQIVTYARSLRGIPWRHQGRSVQHGLDCGGPVALIAHEFALSDFDLIDYGRYPDGQSLLALLDQHLIRIPYSRAQVGDVVALADNHYPCHLGILADAAEPFSLIHCTAEWPRCVVEHRLSDDWKRKMKAVYQFPGLIQEAA